MENIIVSLLKILLYFIIIFLTYYIAHYYEKNDKRIPFIMKIIICLFFVGYSYIATAIPYVMDKMIYAIKFSDDIYLSQVYNDSIGLWIITKILHIFSYDPMVLFSFAIFTFIYLTITAYEKYEEADSFSLLLLLLSEYPFFGFYQIKQCIALGFATLGLVYYFNKKKFLSFVFIVISILFHETAFIIIPILFVIKGSKNKIIRILEYFMLFITCIFFGKISSIVLKIISVAIPSLYSNWNIYLDNNYIISNINFMTVLKGMPFFIMVICYFIFNISEKTKLSNDNKFLIFSVFNCFFIILSGYMYWMFRFGTYFYFFNCILGSKVYKNISIKFNKKFYLFIILLLFIALAIKLWLQYYLIYGGI